MDKEYEKLADDLVQAAELLADTLATKSIRDALIGDLAKELRGSPIPNPSV